MLQVVPRFKQYGPVEILRNQRNNYKSDWLNGVVNECFDEAKEMNNFTTCFSLFWENNCDCLFSCLY